MAERKKLRIGYTGSAWEPWLAYLTSQLARRQYAQPDIGDFGTALGRFRQALNENAPTAVCAGLVADLTCAALVLSLKNATSVPVVWSIERGTVYAVLETEGPVGPRYVLIDVSQGEVYGPISEGILEEFYTRDRPEL